MHGHVMMHLQYELNSGLTSSSSMLISRPSNHGITSSNAHVWDGGRTCQFLFLRGSLAQRTGSVISKVILSMNKAIFFVSEKLQTIQLFQCINGIWPPCAVRNVLANMVCILATFNGNKGTNATTGIRPHTGNHVCLGIGSQGNECKNVSRR